jgi:hypothetical protein
MKRIILLLALLFNCFYIFSQSPIYIDENMKTIDSEIYKIKCHSFVLKCLSIKTDSLNINKVVYKFKFGKTDSLGYSQIRKLLLENNSQKIDANAYLMISYNDTIFDFKASKKSFERHVNQHKTATHDKFNKESYRSNTKYWIKKQTKCRKKFKKLGGETFYVFNYDYGYRKENPENNLIKDSRLFKNAFFKSINSTNFLLIKPDGEYFISGGHLSDSLLKKLLKNKDWTRFKFDWLDSYSSFSYSGKGIFKKDIYHTKHCF